MERRRVAIVDPQQVPPLGPYSGSTYVANLLLSLCVEAEAFGFEPVVHFSRVGRPLAVYGSTIEVVASIYMDRTGLPPADALADALDMPVVVVGSGRERGVWVDSREGVRLAFRHLFELGHRRIVHFAGPPIIFATQERLDEFGRLAKANPDLDLRIARSPEELAAELTRPHRPTAVLAFADGHAAWAIRIAREHGLRVPDDLSVTGFDDDVHAISSDPPITTITNSTDETARLTFRMLTDWLETGRPPEEPAVVPVALVVRESTRPLPTP